MKLEDPVYGVENINEDVLKDLINSESTQRLKQIHQYGMPDEYYHKKNFSRYEHSVGVFILLKRLNASLEEQIAGLLHDTSHLAFSHVADWVFGDPIKEDLQDNYHSEFIKNSDIPTILGKYNFDYKEISNHKNFSLLEREIPSLCADRIDYSLRELKKEGFDTSDFVLNLMNKNGQIVFKNQRIAYKFAKEFLRLQNEHWNGIEARMRYFILSKILRKAVDNNIIYQEDFYKTDSEIIEKLKKSSDSYIIDNLDLLRNGFFIEEAGEGVNLPGKKFRYIDPEILFNGVIKRLSEVSCSFSSLLKEKLNPSKERRFICKEK